MKKDEAQLKDEYNHRIAVIKEAVGLMDFNDNEFSKQALINLLKQYTNLSLNIDFTRIFTLVEVFNQLELNDAERIEYLSYSDLPWSAYLKKKTYNHPGKDLVTKEDFHDFSCENEIYAF